VYDEHSEYAHVKGEKINYEFRDGRSPRAGVDVVPAGALTPGRKVSQRSAIARVSSACVRAAYPFAGVTGR
jgi:hypothetical protein